MKRGRGSHIWFVGTAFVLIAIGAAVGLAACGGGQTASTAVSTRVDESYKSAVLATSYDNALSASDQLILGTMKLEGTAQAVTTEQAAKLLPLWQALQGLTAQVEVNAVLKQIEGAMTQEQLASIAAMQLTQDDLQAWMQENGVAFGGGRPGQDGTFQPPADGQDVSPEVATRRAEFANMTDEQRQAMRATMEAGGGFAGGGAGGGFPGGANGTPGSTRSEGAPRGGQVGFLVRPLVDLLQTRAGETGN